MLIKHTTPSHGLCKAPTEFAVAWWAMLATVNHDAEVVVAGNGCTQGRLAEGQVCTYPSNIRQYCYGTWDMQWFLSKAGNLTIMTALQTSQQV